MYHDQALIPLKTLHFEEGVNVTLGLPIVRTSPDHGTAFDIAGKGVADPAAMIAAIRTAPAECARPAPRVRSDSLERSGRISESPSHTSKPMNLFCFEVRSAK